MWNVRNQVSRSTIGVVTPSTITARVKAALIDHKDIRSTDISVKTENKVVTLSGTVDSSEQHKQALSVAKAVEGVTSVNDKLSVQNEKSASLKGYAGDTAVTSATRRAASRCAATSSSNRTTG